MISADENPQKRTFHFQSLFLFISVGYIYTPYHKLDRTADAEASRKRLIVLRGAAVGHTELAEIYAQWGNTAKALDSLEQAVPDREGDLIYLKVDPLLDPIRDEPRFKAVERALKFPD